MPIANLSLRSTNIHNGATGDGISDGWFDDCLGVDCSGHRGLWVLMPFAIFGTKDLLRQLIREQKRPNELLQAQTDRAKAIRDQVGRTEPRL